MANPPNASWVTLTSTIIRREKTSIDCSNQCQMRPYNLRPLLLWYYHLKKIFFTFLFWIYHDSCFSPTLTFSLRYVYGLQALWRSECPSGLFISLVCRDLLLVIAFPWSEMHWLCRSVCRGGVLANCAIISLRWPSQTKTSSQFITKPKCPELIATFWTLSREGLIDPLPDADVSGMGYQPLTARLAIFN